MFDKPAASAKQAGTASRVGSDSMPSCPGSGEILIFRVKIYNLTVQIHIFTLKLRIFKIKIKIRCYPRELFILPEDTLLPTERNFCHCACKLSIVPNPAQRTVDTRFPSARAKLQSVCSNAKGRGWNYSTTAFCLSCQAFACFQPRCIASEGHTSAHVPHSVHISGSIEYFSPSEIAPTGHSSMHDPQAMQSSLIT